MLRRLRCRAYARARCCRAAAAFLEDAMNMGDFTLRRIFLPLHTRFLYTHTLYHKVWTSFWDGRKDVLLFHFHFWAAGCTCMGLSRFVAETNHPSCFEKIPDTFSVCFGCQHGLPSDREARLACGGASQACHLSFCSSPLSLAHLLASSELCIPGRERRGRPSMSLSFSTRSLSIMYVCVV